MTTSQVCGPPTPEGRSEPKWVRPSNQLVTDCSGFTLWYPRSSQTTDEGPYDFRRTVILPRSLLSQIIVLFRLSEGAFNRESQHSITLWEGGLSFRVTGPFKSVLPRLCTLCFLIFVDQKFSSRVIEDSFFWCFVSFKCVIDKEVRITSQLKYFHVGGGGVCV